MKILVALVLVVLLAGCQPRAPFCTTIQPRPILRQGGLTLPTLPTPTPTPKREVRLPITRKF